MNYLFISPNFPANFKHFSICLKKAGVNVLGIGSEKYDNLDPDLKASLTEYYQVGNMEDYDEMLRACAFLTFRHGKMDRIESHNEYWLELDARLRTDFNVFGDKTVDLDRVKLKSGMKRIFQEAGIPHIRGKILNTKEELLEFVGEVGYPVCAKPDNGVGAASTYKIANETDIDNFLKTKSPVDYMVEEYIEGDIETFDGLVDIDGNIPFTNSFNYNTGVMNIVNQDLDNYYFTLRKIPLDVEEIGRKAVSAFGLKERFFHFEMFRKKDGNLVALELNARPPGAQSMDMLNYANDIDLYNQYARLVAGLPFDAVVTHPYFCVYVGLKVKEGIQRRHTLAEILEKWGSLILEHGPVPDIFAQVMGQYSFILRTPDYEKMKMAIEFIVEKK